MLYSIPLKLSYNGNKNWTFTWMNGKQLASASDGTNTITNTYDVDGKRSSKTVNGVEHKYVVLGEKIVRETVEQGLNDPPKMVYRSTKEQLKPSSMK